MHSRMYVHFYHSVDRRTGKQSLFFQLTYTESARSECDPEQMAPLHMLSLKGIFFKVNRHKCFGALWAKIYISQAAFSSRKQVSY